MHDPHRVRFGEDREEPIRKGERLVERQATPAGARTIAERLALEELHDEKDPLSVNAVFQHRHRAKLGDLVRDVGLTPEPGVGARVSGDVRGQDLDGKPPPVPVRRREDGGGATHAAQLVEAPRPGERAADQIARRIAPLTSVHPRRSLVSQSLQDD